MAIASIERHSQERVPAVGHSARSRHDGCNQCALSLAIGRQGILVISETIDHHEPDPDPGGGSGGEASPLFIGEMAQCPPLVCEIFSLTTVFQKRI